MHSVFLDTDVILDLFIHREPHHTEALHLFSFLKSKGIQGYTSPVVIANVYYMMAKLESKKYALQKTRKLRNLIHVAALDSGMVDAALQSPHRDFEDSIQYYCAVQNGITFLITRNVRDYPKENVRIVLPVEYMRMSAASTSGRSRS